VTPAFTTCSKQTKTPVKMTIGDAIPQTGYSPFIDKLSITLTIPPEDISAIYECVLSAINCTSLFQSAKWSNRFKICKHIAPSGTEERVLFQFGAKTKKGPDCRLEFNPSKLGFDGLIGLDSILGAIFSDGWDYILKHGRVSRLDIAVDLPGMRMDDFLLLPHTGVVYQRFMSKGHLKTVYLGTPGTSQTRIYSKSAHMKALGLPLTQSLVRVERTLRNLQLKVHELIKLKNPFGNLTFVQPMPPPPPGEKENSWICFQHSVQACGLTVALALLPEKRGSRYRKHCKLHPVGWWDPEVIWKYWPDALNVIA
jgi:hypothetical protein